MSLCCAAWGFRDFDLRDYFNAASDAALTAVECMCAPSVPLHLAPDMPMGDLRATLALARQAGVDIVAVATTCDLTTPDVALLRDEIANVERVLDVAERLGAEIVTLPAGWASQEQITPEIYEQVSDALGDLGRAAEDLRLTLALQNQGAITATAEACVRVLEPLAGIENVGLNFDPCNFFLAGQDPYEAFETLRDHIVYAHLKDCITGGGEPQFVPVGEGEIDWAPLLASLEGEFHGYSAVECDLPDSVEDATRESVEFLRRYIGDIPKA